MAVTVNDGALQWTASIDTSQLTRQISDIKNQLNGVAKTANDEAKAIDRITRSAVAAISAYATFQVGTNFLNDIIRVRGEFQQLEVAFETMLGSKEKADKLLAEVTEFAATTPFELKEVAKASKLLLAFGISADKVKDNLRALGDVSAGLGQPIGEIAFLFGQIKTQGRAMTVDIRQFAQRGIPIYEELAKVLRVTVDQVDELITAGKVGFPEIEQVFKNLTAEGSKFGGLMEKQSKTLLGQISNLRDAFDHMLNEIGKSGEDIFADAISGIKFLVDNYKSIIDILKVLVITYGTYKAAVIATNVVTKIAVALQEGLTLKLFLQAKAAKAAELAQKLLNKTILANPYAAAAAAIAALVGALVLFGKTASDAKSKSQLLAEAQEQIGDNLAEIQGKILPYVEALKGANVSEQERIDIYEKLKAIDPKIVEGLDAKTLSYQTLTGKVNAYIEALKKQFKLEANQKAINLGIENLNKLEAKYEDIRKKFGDTTVEIEAIQKLGKPDRRLPGLIALQEQFQKQLEATNKDIFSQEDAIDELVQVQIEGNKKATEDAKKSGKRTIAVIEEEIKALKEKRSLESTSREEALVFEKQIKVLEAELERITGKANKSVQERIELENRLLSMLDKRKGVLDQIADFEREAEQSGLLEEASEIDKINEKREKQLQLLIDTNKEIERFNNQNKTKIPLISDADFDRVNAAAEQLILNAQYKRDAQDFITALNEKSKAFADFLNLQEKGNDILIEKFKQDHAEQLEGFSSFVDLLQAEYDKLFATLSFDGTDDIGQLTKFQAIKKLLDEEIIKSEREQKARNLRNLEDLLEQTKTFEEQKILINKKFDKLEETLDQTLLDKKKAADKELADLEKERIELENKRKQLPSNLEKELDELKIKKAEVKKASQEELDLLEQRRLALQKAGEQELEDLDRRVKAMTEAGKTLTDPQVIDLVKRREDRQEALRQELDDLAKRRRALQQEGDKELADVEKRVAEIQKALTIEPADIKFKVDDTDLNKAKEAREKVKKINEEELRLLEERRLALQKAGQQELEDLDKRIKALTDAGKLINDTQVVDLVERRKQRQEALTQELDDLAKRRKALEQEGAKELADVEKRVAEIQKALTIEPTDIKFKVDETDLDLAKKAREGIIRANQEELRLLEQRRLSLQKAGEQELEDLDKRIKVLTDAGKLLSDPLVINLVEMRKQRQEALRQELADLAKRRRAIEQEGAKELADVERRVAEIQKALTVEPADIKFKVDETDLDKAKQAREEIKKVNEEELRLLEQRRLALQKAGEQELEDLDKRVKALKEAGKTLTDPLVVDLVKKREERQEALRQELDDLEKRRKALQQAGAKELADVEKRVAEIQKALTVEPADINFKVNVEDLDKAKQAREEIKKANEEELDLLEQRRLALQRAGDQELEDLDRRIKALKDAGKTLTDPLVVDLVKRREERQEALRQELADLAKRRAALKQEGKKELDDVEKRIADIRKALTIEPTDINFAFNVADLDQAKKAREEIKKANQDELEQIEQRRLALQKAGQQELEDLDKRIKALTDAGKLFTDPLVVDLVERRKQRQEALRQELEDLDKRRDALQEEGAKELADVQRRVEQIQKALTVEPAEISFKVDEADLDIAKKAREEIIKANQEELRLLEQRRLSLQKAGQQELEDLDKRIKALTDAGKKLTDPQVVDLVEKRKQRQEALRQELEDLAKRRTALQQQGKKELADVEKRIEEIQKALTVEPAEIKFEVDQADLDKAKKAREDQLKEELKLLEERRQAIKDAKAQELADLDNALARQSKLYKQLSLDIIKFSRDQIKQQIKQLKTVLETDKTLTPQMKADIQARVDQLDSILDATNKVSIKFRQLQEDLAQVAGSLGEASDAVRDLNEDLADTLAALSELTRIASNAAGAVASFASGDIIGGIGQAVSVIADVIGVFGKIKKSKEEAKKAIAEFQLQVEKGERDYQALIRERERQEAKANKSRLKGLQEELKLLEQQRIQTKKNFDEIFAQLQKEEFISSQTVKKKHGGLFSFLSGSEVVNELKTLAGKSFEEIEQLFTQGKLTEKAAALFEELKKARDEGVDIDRLLEENKLAAQELFTGTTADNIADTIAQGLAEGKRSVQDFAGDFERFMKDAILNSLKFRFLEGPVQKLFDQFSAAAESDGQLTNAEIDRLKDQYDTIIKTAVTQFEQLQDIANINFDGEASREQNTLRGAIKGITEQQADLLAGQFGGLRISVIEQVRQATRGVEVLQNIESNTARLIRMEAIWSRIENNGLKVI